MTLPLPRTYAPAEALLVDELPTGGEWMYEPKWDGFRALAFRDGAGAASVALVSKAGKPLTRYFPDVAARLVALGARRFVLDGEIVVPVDDGELSFDELLLRIHPAKSRVEKLAREHPAAFVAFDLLVDAKGKSLVDLPLAERRERLEQFHEEFGSPAGLLLSPTTTRLATVKRWFRSVGGGLDGVMAKRLDLPYQSGERGGMQKMKAMRTAECVVGGFRYASKGELVGSLLLGLYGDDGLLHHVGFTSNIPREEKPAITKRLEKLVKAPGFTGQAPGGPSRWSTERTSEWEPLAPKLVVEVRYDHFSGGRFRHGTSFLRWRPDKSPRQCTMAQVEQEGRSALALVR
jgi:ATP-dependent DNA ligase